MKETETKATTGFASAVWLEGVDLNLGDRADCTSHLRWAQIKSFHFPPPKARCLWLVERRRQQGLGWLIELPLAPALSWLKSIINPLLGLDNLQQAFKPLRSSMCLNHHSPKCTISRCWQQTSCFGSCTAVQSKQPPSHGALIGCPKPPYTELSFSLTIGKDTGRKTVKLWAIPPCFLSFGDVAMPHNVRWATCRSRSNSWS